MKLAAFGLNKMNKWIYLIITNENSYAEMNKWLYFQIKPTEQYVVGLSAILELKQILQNITEKQPCTT